MAGWLKACLILCVFVYTDRFFADEARPGEAVTILRGECNNTCAEFSYKLSEPSYLNCDRFTSEICQSANTAILEPRTGVGRHRVSLLLFLVTDKQKSPIFSTRPHRLAIARAHPTVIEPYNGIQTIYCLAALTSARAMP